MATRKQTTAKVIEVLTKKPGQGTDSLAKALELSTSRTREIMGILVKEGIVTRRQVEEDGFKVLRYDLAEATQAAADVRDTNTDILDATPSKPKANKKAGSKKKDKAEPKERRVRQKTSGLGHPDAKKIVNPQNTLELKKAAVKEKGGSMRWESRRWVVTMGKKSYTVRSRDLAAMTIDDVVACNFPEDLGDDD